MRPTCTVCPAARASAATTRPFAEPAFRPSIQPLRRRSHSFFKAACAFSLVYCSLLPTGRATHTANGSWWAEFTGRWASGVTNSAGMSVSVNGEKGPKNSSSPPSRQAPCHPSR
jgi:hypothetical protein